MGFLQTVSNFGALQIKPPKRISEAEQLTKMRENFALRATRQVSLIKAGSQEKSASWYITLVNEAGETEFVVALRNGAKVIPLSGQMTHVSVNSEERAIEFYEQAISACERGELDAVLKATCRKPAKLKVPAAVAANAAS